MTTTMTTNADLLFDASEMKAFRRDLLGVATAGTPRTPQRKTYVAPAAPSGPTIEPSRTVAGISVAADSEGNWLVRRKEGARQVTLVTFDKSATLKAVELVATAMRGLWADGYDEGFGEGMDEGWEDGYISGRKTFVPD